MEATRMSPAAPPAHRILVIANRTCPCPTLADEVARRASAAPTDVLIVAPALNSRLRHWVSDVDEAVARAHERLDLAITELRRRGVIARGEIGDADPLLAIADALAGFPADEMVIATLPTGRSNWIERGLVEKATARFGLPIAHLVSSYELIDEAARSEPARAAA
jgi:hypothetical protein